VSRTGLEPATLCLKGKCSYRLSHSNIGNVFMAYTTRTLPNFNRAIYLRLMATVTEIGSLISRRPDIRGGRPCIAGTSVSVRRIAQWYNMGLIPEEISRKFGHLSLAQVHAALAYYHANQAEIDADLEIEVLETEAFEQQHRR
jgi:uncharacterized protein (DUF433 family)